MYGWWNGCYDLYVICIQGAILSSGHWVSSCWLGDPPGATVPSETCKGVGQYPRYAERVPGWHSRRLCCIDRSLVEVPLCSGIAPIRWPCLHVHCHLQRGGLAQSVHGQRWSPLEWSSLDTWLPSTQPLRECLQALLAEWYHYWHHRLRVRLSMEFSWC